MPASASGGRVTKQLAHRIRCLCQPGLRQRLYRCQIDAEECAMTCIDRGGHCQVYLESSMTLNSKTGFLAVVFSNQLGAWIARQAGGAEKYRGRISEDRIKITNRLSDLANQDQRLTTLKMISSCFRIQVLAWWDSYMHRRLQKPSMSCCIR